MPSINTDVSYETETIVSTLPVDIPKSLVQSLTDEAIVLALKSHAMKLYGYIVRTYTDYDDTELSTLLFTTLHLTKRKIVNRFYIEDRDRAAVLLNAIYRV